MESEQVRIIDADALFQEKVGQLPEAVENADDPIEKYGFDPYGDGDSSETISEEEASVSALFGEAPVRDEEIQQSFSEEDEDGFSTGIDAENVEEATMGVGVDTPNIMEEVNEEAAKILEIAKEQAEEYMHQARAEAESQSEQIFEQARAQGFEQGIADSQERLQAEIQDAQRQCDERVSQIRQEYDEKLRVMEPFLVEELTGIYEHIFNVDLSTHRSVIRHLITNTLHATEASQSYLIHVSAEDYSALSMQKASLREECSLPEGATMELVEDISLKKNQCMIETDEGIFDCSLTVELGELKRKLMLLAYEGTRK